MSAPAPPRFVPILTEVVHADPAASPRVPAADTGEALADRIVRRVLDDLEPRLQQAIAQLLAQQSEALDVLRTDIARIVTRQVTEALASPPSPVAGGGPGVIEGRG